MINAEQKKRIDYLCGQIEIEEDASTMVELARELNDLLEAKVAPFTSPHEDTSLAKEG